MRWWLLLATAVADEPTADAKVHSLEVGVSDAKAAAHVALGAAALSRAEQNAAQAQGVQAQAELSAAKVHAETPKLELAATLAEKSGAAAAANEALESTKGMQDAVIAESQDLARKEVHSE